MEQDQQQPSQQTPPIAMAPPPVQPVEPIQPVQPVPPLPSQQTPIGATCNAQACIGVDNPGAFTLTVRDYDSYGQQQTATFNLPPQ